MQIKKSGKTKKKLIPLSKLSKKLDAVFSMYIRLKYADNKGMVSCYTCNVKKHWKEMQNGHYISRRHYCTRWLETNCHPQCVGCNVFNQGNSPSYALHLIKDYGAPILETLEGLKNNICKMTRGDYEINIEEYEKKIKNLRKP